MDALSTAKQYLRRKYTGQLPALKALADQIAAEAFETVTLTGQSFEGGSHQGQVTFPRMQYLGAVEEIIVELTFSAGDTPITAPSKTSFADFGCSQSLV